MMDEIAVLNTEWRPPPGCIEKNYWDPCPEGTHTRQLPIHNANLPFRERLEVDTQNMDLITPIYADSNKN